MKLGDKVTDQLTIYRYFGQSRVKNAYAIFRSSTDISGETQYGAQVFPATNTYAALQTELENLGQSNAAVPTPAQLIGAPYPSRMRCTTSLTKLTGAHGVLVTRVRYYAYDTLITSGSGQDAGVFAALQASLSTLTEGSPQSRFQNGRQVDWQPNFFRPYVAVNGNNIFQEYETNYWGENDRVTDMAIGDYLPFEENIEYWVSGPISRLDVKGMCGLYVNVAGGLIVRFPLMCKINFLYT